MLQQSGRIDVSSLLTLAAAARTIDAQFTCAACNAVIRTFQAATQGARSRVSGFAQRTVSLVHLVGIARLEVELAVREGDVPPGVQMPTDVAIVNLAHLVVGPSQLVEGPAPPLDLHAEIAASMTVLAASLAQYNPPRERSKPPPAPKLPLMPLPPMLPAVNALLPPETAHAALSVAVALQLLLRGVTNGPAWPDPLFDEAVEGSALAPTLLQPSHRPLLALVRALLRQLDMDASQTVTAYALFEAVTRKHEDAQVNAYMIRPLLVACCMLTLKVTRDACPHFADIVHRLRCDAVAPGPDDKTRTPSA